MTPRMREAYPGIAPWEWEAHPAWLSRVQCRLVAEDEGREIRRMNAEQDA